jgi:hypothetical protein
MCSLNSSFGAASQRAAPPRLPAPQIPCLQTPTWQQAPYRRSFIQLATPSATKLQQAASGTADLSNEKQIASKQPATAENDADDLLQPAIPAEPQHVIITDGFEPELCKDLRQTFDQCMGDPRRPNLQERCV